MVFQRKQKHSFGSQGGQIHIKAVRKGLVQTHQGHGFVCHGNGKVGGLRQEVGGDLRARLQRPGVLHGRLRHQQHRARGPAARGHLHIWERRSSGKRGGVRQEFVRSEAQRNGTHQRKHQIKVSEILEIHSNYLWR